MMSMLAGRPVLVSSGRQVREKPIRETRGYF